MRGKLPQRLKRCILLDWGNTVMRVFPEFAGPMATWPRVEAVDGIAETLASLRPGWTIALATNADDSREDEIWSALGRAGLDGLIDRVYCLRGVGQRKSAPEYFQQVLGDLGIEPYRAVMVGDDFETDVLPATRCGIRAIWFDEGGSENRAGAMYRTIHDLRELPETLETLIKG